MTKSPPKKEIPECHVIDPRLVVGWPPAYPEPHPRYDVTEQYEDH